MTTNFQLTTANIIIIFIIWFFIGATSAIVRSMLITTKRYLNYIPLRVARDMGTFTGALANSGKKFSSELINELISIVRRFLKELSEFAQRTTATTMSLFNPSIAEVASYINRKGETESDNTFQQLSINDFKVQQVEALSVIKYQKVLGASIEFVLLSLALYSSIGQSLILYATLFPTYKIPDVFSNDFLSFLIAMVVPPLAMGIYIGDMIGLTRLTNINAIKGIPRKLAISVGIFVIIFSLINLGFLAFSRFQIISESSYGMSNSIALFQSFLAIPSLITVFYLSGGVRGLLIVLTTLMLLLQIVVQFTLLLVDVIYFMFRIGLEIIIGILWLCGNLLVIGFYAVRWLISGAFVLIVGLFSIITFPASIITDTLFRVYGGEAYYRFLEKSLPFEITGDEDKEFEE